VPPRRAHLLAALALLSGCDGSKRFIAQENWVETPDLRIALVSLNSEHQVVALDGPEPLDVVLPEAFQRTDKGEVWLFGYTVDDVRAAFPSLAGKSSSEIAALLRPSFALDGQALPPAREVLRADLSKDLPTRLSYSAASWGLWTSAVARGTVPDVQLHIDQSALCAGIDQATILGPEREHLDQIVAVDDQAAIVVSSALPYSRTEPLRLYRLSGTEITGLAPQTVTGSVARPIAWDATQGTGYGIAQHRLFAFDASGASRPPPPPPAGYTSFEEVAVGRDGSFFALLFWGIGNLGQGVVYTRQGQTLELLTPGIDQHPTDLFFAVNASRALAYSVCWGAVYDGHSWATALFDQNCMTNTGSRRTLRFLAGDPETLIGVGNGGFISLQDGSGEFIEARVPEARGRTLWTAAGLRGGRVLVGGDGGTLLVRTLGTWCKLAVDPSLRVYAASASPSGQTAYVLAGPPGLRPDLTGGPSTLITVRVPLAR